MLEILGILIGFIAVILLLSVLVTALVQTISSAGEYRFRALERAYKATRNNNVLPRTAELASPWLKELPVAPEKSEQQRRVLGATRLDKPTFTGPPGTDDAARPASVAARDPDSIARLIDQPIQHALESHATWIDKEDILATLRSAGADAVVLAAVEKGFEQTKRRMEDIFLRWTRLTTIACALAVALLFQVSTPLLLQRLLEDDEFRVRAEAAGTEHAQDAGERYQNAFVQAGLDARVTFIAKHSDLRDALGEVTLEARSVDDLIADVATALEDRDDHDALASEYRGLVERSLARGDFADLRRAGLKTDDDLAGLDLKPFDGRWDFYFPNDEHDGRAHFDFARLLGVLVTAILLSFGAPFWYERLKELVGLKDAMRKKNESDQAKAQS